MTEAKKLALAQRLFFLYFTKHFLNLGRVLLDERRKTKDERNRQQSLRQSPTQPNVKFSSAKIEKSTPHYQTKKGEFTFLS
jgi:hypothetical protein